MVARFLRCAGTNSLGQQVAQRLLQHRFRDVGHLFAWNHMITIRLGIESDLEIALLAAKSVLSALAGQVDAIGAAAPSAGLMSFGIGALGVVEPVGSSSRGGHTVVPFTLRSCACGF